MTQSSAVLDDLYKVIVARKNADPTSSYTAQLLAAGTQKCAQKLGEEAVEAAIAAVQDKTDELVRESADVLYHLLVLWTAQGVAPDDVYAELAKRRGQSGLEEKAGRRGDSSGGS